jgi:hypothetical protein
MAMTDKRFMLIPFGVDDNLMKACVFYFALRYPLVFFRSARPAPFGLQALAIPLPRRVWSRAHPTVKPPAPAGRRKPQFDDTRAMIGCAGATTG